MYDSKGRLTRDGAIKVIAGGGSVVMNGQLYTNISSLPGEADFAKGDKDAEDGARERLQKQIDDAQTQLRSLGKTTKGTVTAVAPVVATNSAPAADDFDSLGIEQLKEIAKERNVPHYWSMSQEKLVAALREKA